MTNREGDWITTEEAAKISGFNVEYIRRLARKEVIRSKKWERSWMISRESLLEYLSEERKTGPKPQNTP